MAGTDLPPASLLQDTCHVPGKSLRWIPGVGRRSGASLGAQTTMGQRARRGERVVKFFTRPQAR